MTSIVDYVIKGVQILSKFANPTTAFFGAAWALAGLLIGVGDRIDSIISKVDQITVNLVGVADFSPLSLANYLFPLDQLLLYISSYLVLLLICAVVRIIKSFVPTIS
jgi:hypothetical protein